VRRAVLLGLAAALAVAAPAQADTIDVTTRADSADATCPGPNCSLREAIRASIENGGVNSPDRINVPAGTYELSQGQLVSHTTNRDVTIVGAGADRTIIRAAPNQRVLEIQGESFFSLRELTLAGGEAVDGDGGNLLVWGAEARLDHVRLTGGRAVNGGGLALENGWVTASHTLIDGNTALAAGGGVAATSAQELSLLTSTVAGNRAPEGGGVVIGEQTQVSRITLSTVAHNPSGGGIAVRAGVPAPTVTGSILAGNAGRNCTGTFSDGGGNLETGTDCAFTRPESRQNAHAGLATALVSDGGTLPVLPISADSAARDLAGPCSGTDQRDVARPFGAACDAGAYEYVPPPPPPPEVPLTPVPPVATPAPTPVANRTIVVGEERGTVKVKLPGSKRYVDLDESRGIPVGSTVDARKGRVRLTSVPKAGAAPQTAVFWDGIFRVTQSKGITNLTLTEPLAPCSKKARAAAKKVKKRKLWGNGKGAFRTTGKYSAATVRGTRWLVEDSCAGTRTTVKQGSVTVRAGKLTKVLRAGKSYLARPRR